jgi:N6-L-threonylcarbamoyladenine synthase
LIVLLVFPPTDKQMFPRPYLDNSNLDFSFSGIKTAMAYHVRDNPHLVIKNRTRVDENYIPSPELAKVCASYNWSIAQTLKIKLKRALERNHVKSVILAGGVAANTMVRQAIEELAREHHIESIIPQLSLCTDNAAMIAWYGQMLINEGYHHSLNLEAVPRGKKIPWDYLHMKT